MISSTGSLNSTQPLITINAAAQVSLKLMSLNYFSWIAQFNALFYGLDLLWYLDDTHPSPSATIVENQKIIPNPDYISWRRQDQLILHVIFASLSESVIPLVSFATTSREVWDRFSHLYAKNPLLILFILRTNFP